MVILRSSATILAFLNCASFTAPADDSIYSPASVKLQSEFASYTSLPTTDAEQPKLTPQYVRVSMNGLERVATTRHPEGTVKIGGIEHPTDAKVDTGARTSFLDVEFEKPFACEAQTEGVDYTGPEYEGKFVEIAEDLHEKFDSDEPKDEDADDTIYVCDGTTTFRVRQENGTLGSVLTETVVDISNIKPRENEKRTIRPVINAEIAIDDFKFQAEVNLGPRERFNDRLVIAFTDIKEQGIVVVSEKELQQMASYSQQSRALSLAAN